MSRNGNSSFIESVGVNKMMFACTAPDVRPGTNINDDEGPWITMDADADGGSAPASSRALMEPAGDGGYSKRRSWEESAAPTARAFEPPHNAKVVLAGELLKKEDQYPFAWKSHLAYLYSEGTMVFAQNSSGSSGFTGVECPPKLPNAHLTLRIQLSSSTMVLSPSKETFAVGVRGASHTGKKEEILCTCQCRDARAREEWVRVLLKTVLDFQCDNEKNSKARRVSAQLARQESIRRQGDQPHEGGEGQGRVSARRAGSSDDEVQAAAKLRFFQNFPETDDEDDSETDGTQFTCFTGTKIQILTLRKL